MALKNELSRMIYLNDLFQVDLQKTKTLTKRERKLDCKLDVTTGYLSVKLYWILVTMNRNFFKSQDL